MSEAEIRLYDQSTKMFFDFDPEIFTREIAKGFKGSESPPSPLVNKWITDAINAAIIQNHVPDDRVMRMEVTLEGAEKE